jgi:hypothetical protein
MLGELRGSWGGKLGEGYEIWFWTRGGLRIIISELKSKTTKRH